MQKYINAVASAVGRPVPGATVTVLTYPGGATATIYSDNGVTPRSNPISTDGNGSFSFYAADGRYSLQISGPGIVNQTIPDILLEDPIDGGSPGSFTTLTVASAGTVAGSAIQTLATLAASGSAGNIGSTAGTVQSDLDARPTIGSLAIPGTAANIGTAAGTVQTDLDARPTSASLAASGGAALVGGTWFGGVVATVAALATSIGASLLGFIQAGMGAVLRSIQDKLRERVSVKDFGAVGDGVTNNDAAFAAACAFVAANPTRNKLVFPSGIYVYSVSPNWAIQSARIEADGEVRLRYSGTGNVLIFDGGAASAVFDCRFTGNFILEGTASAGHGVYVRSVHHSKIEARVAGCGSTSSGLMSVWCVCTEFNVKSSGGEGWYSGAKPLHGIYLTNRGAGENTSDCVFLNPIVEAVTGDGIVCDGAVQNIFLGGTSEGNTGNGITLTANSINNHFYGIDLENNGGQDISDAGKYNTFHAILSDRSITTVAGAIGSTFEAGEVNAIVNNGAGTVLSHVRYSANGGLISGAGANLIKRDVYSIDTGKFDPNKNAASLIAPPVSCADTVTTTVLTLPSTGNNMFHVYAYLPGTGNAAAYGAYAVIYQDVASSRIMSQTNGSLLTITLSGQNVQVTQSSGATQAVYAMAQSLA